jgi:hypothetical protein
MIMRSSQAVRKINKNEDLIFFIIQQFSMKFYTRCLN